MCWRGFMPRRFPIILGLTGSIAMGKSTLAGQFRQLGVPVCDSDALVHRLLARGGRAVEKVALLFPAAYADNAIDRAALGREVFGDSVKLKALESILHPMVRAEQEAFIRLARRRGKRVVVLDIPLLFETGAQGRCDHTVLATAPSFLQRQRALARPRMTIERFEEILARQIPDVKKRLRADWIVFTGLGKYASLCDVRYILNRLV
jgi:dephospho-CoA kinase